jgi:hypothetical protein
MWNDPIVEEIKAGRRQYAARFNYDIHAIVRDLQQRQEAEGRKVVSFEAQRKPETNAPVPAQS